MSDDEQSFADFRSNDLPDGVAKKVLKESETHAWKKPKTGAEVKVNYRCWIEGGDELIDETSKLAEFTLGTGQVIKGWDLAVATMRVGEIAQFTMQPEFAYGEMGQPPAVPPNAVLVYELELVSFIAKDDLFKDGGVIKSLIQEGSGWRTLKSNGEARITLRVAGENDTVLEERSGMDYILGSGTLGPFEKVVEKALMNMNEGERCILKCAKDYIPLPEKDEGRITIELKLEEIYNVTDVSLMKDGSVTKKEINKGDSKNESDGARPNDGVKVELKVISATDGTNLLPGFAGPKEVRFTLGSGEICDALEGAVREMSKGEHALVTCLNPARSCVGPLLGLTKVTAEKVVFTTELLSFEKGRDRWSMSTQEIIENALMQKELAGRLFKAKRFELALDKYNKVISSVKDTSNFGEDLKKYCAELRRLCDLNKAAVYLQLDDPTNALISCNIVLKDERRNVKALFRRGKAHDARGEHAEAALDFESVLELDPENSEAKVLLPSVRRKQKHADKVSRSTFAKMCEGFGRLGSEQRVAKPEPEHKPVPVEEPREKPTTVTVTFRVELPLDMKYGSTHHIRVVGAPDVIGSWDNEKSIQMKKLPPKWEPPTGSGRVVPVPDVWEAIVEVPETEGRAQYRYLVRGPEGDRLEEGEPHAMNVAGMAGNRMRCSDQFRRDSQERTDD